jgi:cephalosporin-C deacetylase
MTKGIEDPKTYYYRRVFVDALRALGAVRSLPDVDASSIAVQEAAGAAASPWLLEASQRSCGCHARRAVSLPLPTSGRHMRRAPYTEIIRYLAIHRGVGDSAFTTLSYFDGVSFAERASAPALSSVGLMDQVCPPSTVYAAYHAYGGAKGHRRLPVQ